LYNRRGFIKVIIIIVFRNAIKVLGFEVIDIVNPEDIDAANMIIFPGVGSFGQAIKVL
jgi:glutamine amidotransferase/cyclase